MFCKHKLALFTYSLTTIKCTVCSPDAMRDPVLCLISFLQLNIPGRNGKGDILSCHLTQKRESGCSRAIIIHSIIYVEETLGPWLYTAVLIYGQFIKSPSQVYVSPNIYIFLNFFGQ